MNQCWQNVVKHYYPCDCNKKYEKAIVKFLKNSVIFKMFKFIQHLIYFLKD